MLLILLLCSRRRTVWQVTEDRRRPVGTASTAAVVANSWRIGREAAASSSFSSFYRQGIARMANQRSASFAPVTVCCAGEHHASLSFLRSKKSFSIVGNRNQPVVTQQLRS